jgi:hypothetical protein
VSEPTRHNGAMKRCKLFEPAVSALIVMFAAQGCSHQQMYESLQAGQRNECQRLAEPERTKCLDAARLRYDDYAKERDKTRPATN